MYEENKKSSKKSGRSNPSPGQPVTGADDFFMKDHLHPVDVSGKRRDRDRRWNSGLSRNVKPSHPMKGHVNAKQHQQKNSGAQSRPVRSTFGGNQCVHPQGKCRTENDKQLGRKKCNPGKETLSSANHTKMEGTRANPSQGRNHVVASDHELDPENFTFDKEGDGRSGFDSDMTYFISDSDLGLSGPSKEDVSSGESHDSTDESNSTENSSGSSREQDHSDALYDSVESDSSSDSSDDDNDDNESTEPSDDDEGNFSDGSHSDDSFDGSDEDEDGDDDDEGNFSDGSHSDDSFDGSDEDEDEDDSDHLYNNFSSDDSESNEEYYDELEEDSEEHIYDDPDDLYCSDHIYENPAEVWDPDDSLYDSV